MLAKSIFWTAFFFVFYTYAGYPLLLFFWSRCFPKKIKKSTLNVFPAVSIVIAAKNEEKNIGPRLDNLLAQNYPKDKLEIIIISDGSNDKTEAIVLEYSTISNTNTPSIKLFSFENSKGKPSAINQGVTCAKGEIIVFTDARQKFDVNAIEELVANFNDPKVGCVSGELLFVKDSDSTIREEMGLYWKIEKTVRKLESTIGSVVGATGAIYAIRKSLFQELPQETLLDDVLTPMNITLQGFRTIFESNACAYDVVSQNARQEWRRKVRTLSGNWQLLHIKPALFSPLHNPLWWRFLSHKFFRLLVPFCLPVLLVSALLAGGTFYIVLTFFQLLFYILATSGWLIPQTRSFRLINLSYFFMVLNCAAINGFVYWATGNCSKAWQPSPPSAEPGK
jgi:poly-beta-1,6-N-acetyl-D-glucosamine synthase